MSRGLPGGKLLHQYNKSQLSLIVLDDENELFVLNGQLWVEVIITTFLYAVLTVRVLTARNNDMKLVETRTVHFARIKSSFSFEGINKLGTRVSNFVTCLPPEIPRDIAFIP